MCVIRFIFHYLSLLRLFEIIFLEDRSYVSGPLERVTVSAASSLICTHIYTLYMASPPDPRYGRALSSFASYQCPHKSSYLGVPPEEDARLRALPVDVPLARISGRGSVVCWKWRSAHAWRDGCDCHVKV